MRTSHLGHFEPWKEVIKDRIIKHLHRVRLSDIIPTVLKTVSINKKDHIINYNRMLGGNMVGIDGTDQIYIRENNLIRFEL
ncbi:hypothetical protein [Zunongwangia endophytica]|uniref:hypothetical protein n=1 Tax=Zunongwangia endophytica TaxID=1808945 RepID=UPI0036DA0035